MADEEIRVYERNCNDCKHSSAAGWTVVCHNNKRPKGACIGRMANTRSAVVRPTMPACKQWEQGKACWMICESLF